MTNVLYLTSLPALGTVPGTPPDSGAYRGLLPDTPGSGTFVTNTSTGAVTPPSAGTHVTATAAGTPLTWVGPPVVKAVTIAGAATLSINGLESNAAANASIYGRLGKLEPDGTFTWFATTASAGAEFTTTASTLSRALTVSSTALAAGDRPAVELYLDDATAVTLASGYTVTVNEGVNTKLTLTEDLELGGAYSMAPVASDLDTIADSDVAKIASADSDYISVGSAGAYIGLTAPTSPTGTFVAVAPTVRCKSLTATGNVHVKATDGRTLPSADYYAAITSSYSSVTPPANLFNTSALGTADIADVLAYVSPGGQYVTVDQLYGTAYYLAAPEIDTPSLPTGTMTTTQTPQCAVSVAAIVDKWQHDNSDWLTGVDVEFQVFRSSDAPGASPPTGVTPVWSTVERTAITGYDGGISPTPLEVSAIPDALDNDDYYLFCRVSRDTPAGPRLAYGSWVKSAEWTINVTPPDAPTALTITPNTTVQGIAITTTVPATAGYTASTSLVSVERSDDAGTTWAAVRNMTDLSVTAGATVWSLGYDMLAPRGSTTLQYRVRVRALNTTLNAMVTSAWYTVTGQTGLAAVTTWMLVCVDTPASTWADVPVDGTVSQQSGKQTATFAPLDRDGTVIVVGSNAGRKCTLKVVCSGATEETALDTLEAEDSPYLLLDPFGHSDYIAVLSVSREMDGGMTVVSTATIEYQVITL